MGVEEGIVNIVDNDFAPGEFYFESPTFGGKMVDLQRLRYCVQMGIGVVEVDYSTTELSAEN